MTARFAAAFRAFYLQPTAPTDLAVCRVLFFGLLAWFMWDIDQALWGLEPADFWTPMWTFRVFQLPLLSEATMQWMQSAWLAALVLSAIGCCTRVSTATAFVLGFYLLGVKLNFGKLNHGDTLPVITLGILMMSRCGDAWSIDALVRRWRGASIPVTPNGEYTWPLRLVQVMIALAMFAAGVIKLRTSGLEWIFSDNLAMRLIQAQYVFPDSDIQPAWSFWVAHQPWVSRTMAGLTFVFELGFPLALYSRKSLLLFAPSMFMAQVSIIFLLGPNFSVMMIGYAFFVPWSEIAAALNQRWSRQAPQDSRIELGKAA